MAPLQTSEMQRRHEAKLSPPDSGPSKDGGIGPVPVPGASQEAVEADRIEALARIELGLKTRGVGPDDKLDEATLWGESRDSFQP